MSQEQKETLENNEEQLNKSIDALIEDVFFVDEPVETEEVEKSIDIAKDAEKTADAAVAKAPKGQKDEARGAGRPKQISDVPQTDMDGDRENEYDDEISENEGKELQPEETKQSPSMDQTQEKKRMGGKPKAPAMRPFRKSEDGEEVEISDEEYKEFQEFKKSKAEAESQAKEAEELKKAEEAKKEQEDLLKSAVTAATEDLRKSMAALEAKNEEQAALIKSMAKQPVRAKSVTDIAQLEKSVNDEVKEPEAFSKSEMADAIFELAKSGKISQDSMYEYDMTKTLSNPEDRKVVEKHLQGK